MTTYKNQPHEVMQGIFFYLIIKGDFMLKRRKFRISSSFFCWMTQTIWVRDWQMILKYQRKI
jgi:hypothetical protein